MMSKKGYKFNTFYGVVVPSTLAILGAVMYFILPQVLGSVGLFNTILIIILAHTITVATAFSLSSIASNIDVKEGGLYYMVSRSLGREFGGSTGILLYLAQTISIAFYAAAFARAIHGVLLRFSISFSEFHLSLLFFILFGILSFRGARKVLNIQTVILAIVLLSLASIFLSAHDPQAGTSFVQSLPFWVAFAMFFPAVTGLDAGVGMSGDLKHPRKSLIKGTFIAIGFTFMVYILLSLKLSMIATPAALVENKHIIESVAAIPFMVVIGALVATGSSVLSLSMTAPRTLRALVVDRMLPTRLNILSRSFSSKSTDPHFALLFTLVLGGGILFLGSLELISQVLTILFLSAYSWINFSVIMERFSKNPSFRPQFKVHWSIPLYGVIACYVIMFFFNVWIALAVILFQLFISLLVASHKRSPDSINGIWDGVFFRIARNILGREDLGSVSAKNYRLTVLAFSISKRHRRSLVTLMDWMTARSSLSKFFILLPGRLSSRYKYGEREHERFKRFVASKQIRLFSRSIVTTDYQSCIRDVVQSEGLGGLDLNTVLFDMDESIQLNKLIPDIIRLKKNVVVMKDNHGLLTKKNTFRTIDVWWNSRNNGNFMLLIAHLISQSYPWKKHKPVIRVFKIISSSKHYHREYSSLKKVIDESRI
ncbi:MAG: amino acid permease, partial [Nanoarchaeota archaeon]